MSGCGEQIVVVLDLQRVGVLLEHLGIGVLRLVAQYEVFTRLEVPTVFRHMPLGDEMT
jgi:hypothetical protein